jgi:hypothetical protein
VPAYTEARIRELVSAALAASSAEDIDKILPELRTALGKMPLNEQTLKKKSTRNFAT